MINRLGETSIQREFEADIAIIGAGAMGLAIASEFLHTGFSILLLESGLADSNCVSDTLLAVENIGHKFNGATSSGRRRVLGGATTLWGGQFLPLGDIVFTERPWLGVSGWPFQKTLLKPFYKRAADLAQLKLATGGDSLWIGHGINPPLFNPEKLKSEFSSWSPRPNFANNMRGDLALSSNVEVLLDATVTEILINRHGEVQELSIRSTLGHAAMAKARFYILAAGAIESARLLLASRRQDDRGIGNSNGLVGRYFQDHISLPVARIIPKNRATFHQIYDNFIVGGTKYAPKVVISDALQRENRILNVGGFFRFSVDNSISINALKTLIGHLKRRTIPSDGIPLLAKSIINLPEVAKFAYGVRIKHRIQASREGEIFLEAHSEQLPRPESRISLSKKDDRLGMPLACLNWRIADESRMAIKAYTNTVRDEFHRLCLADVEPLSDVIDSPYEFQRSLSDVYHQMGTLRMSTNPEEGVTNPDARMHEVPNLYVAGCSLFPVSGYSNPTHTGIALAVRLADHLKSRLSK
ncbi:GMC family oxidoreductase [Synechococcus sp. CBW1002]|uniref:GMC oxidoreductase n=1 Tax=Synechococcus sp. CBW1002 TaxID=1353134 RepID=UPI0018CED330|nr:GMC family oxidoreductase [Synechococcus sp. CBW1002]QPN59136.1 GMC family oxidoreductase [Synechococcus sp. CBW1002]